MRFPRESKEYYYVGLQLNARYFRCFLDACLTCIQGVVCSGLPPHVSSPGNTVAKTHVERGLHLNAVGHRQLKACPAHAHAILSVTGFLPLHFYCFTRFAGRVPSSLQFMQPAR